VRTFESLSERDVLALAISLEEEDARIYADLADGLNDQHPEQAEQFRSLRAEEDGHRHRLLDLYRRRFGDHLPLIRRQDVKGFVPRPAVWLARPLSLDDARKQAQLMEAETKQFYESALLRAEAASVRQLLGDLAEEERKHEAIAASLGASEPGAEQAARRRLFVLQVIQPGLAGLMDGSVSTLAPLFAAAFATGDSWATFLVGMAAGVGAGISMGFAEALSDDGSLTGRGRPLIRGAICGAMTALGGLGHTLPYLLPSVVPSYANTDTATAVAIGVVIVELLAIAWVRHRFMDTPWVPSIFQVVVGGLLVFLAGILIGAS
jgi:erythrin-vacuolar iron transport family protein